ncbi:cyclin family protein [Haloarcula hispanica]|uniref:cyclin family protein n=1 Tax=Haloarcula hispanica TaxID=51589 RepID=UPI001198286D|nr:cyclin family protein [Haloarcula hispanica]
MAWESLAAGAVLLAGRASGVERTPAQIAQFAKSSRERVCAAARKIRLQTPVDAPVVRDRAVDRVVTPLGETCIDVETGIELVRVGERLLDVADTVPIGPGMDDRRWGGRLRGRSAHAGESPDSSGRSCGGE